MGILTGRLKPFSRMLTEWQVLNTRLGTSWVKTSDTSPWWDNERSSISVLAGAIWLSGGWAFEEGSAQKAFSGSRRNHRGRCDINFQVGNQEFVAEAKKCWPNIGNTETAKSIVEASLKAAICDAGRISDAWCPRLGIVFASPMLHYSRQDEMDLLISAFIAEAVKIRGVSVAWTFPRAACNLRPTNQYRNYIFPGAVMVIHSVD